MHVKKRAKERQMKRKGAVGRNRIMVGILAFTIAVMAFTAAVALAANVAGDGTLVGSTGSDAIKAGNGNDTIWGRGGSDSITAGEGNDVIDGGGSCPAGLAPGDYPNGLPGADYCQHGPSGTFGTDSIKALDGSDTVYGNGGPNTITLGNGADTVFAYGGPNTVKVLNGHDTINAYGTGTYTTGTGEDTINAQFSKGLTIKCGSSHTTVVTFIGADDSISALCTVKFVSQQQPVPGQTSSTRTLAKTAGKAAAPRRA